MTATYEQARNEMFALVQAARDAELTGVHTEWQGKPPKDNNAPPPQGSEWIRVSVQHDSRGSRQASLACHSGRRRWRRTGSLYVQCFAPIQSGGLARAMQMACVFRDAVQASTGTPGGVWFRDPTASEGEVEKNWECAIASARFTYDEVK